MANMSYCRFENTYKDLYECEDALYSGDIAENHTERKYAKKLIALCKKISESFDEDDIEDVDEEED
jgi:hypothetical protein